MVENEKPGPEPLERRGDRDILASIGGFFRDHPAIVGTILYLYVSALGVVYQWGLFKEFRINVLDFAEANDFLLAAFREPLTFLMTVPTAIVAIFEYAFLSRREPFRSEPFRFVMRVFLLVVLIGALVGTFYWPHSAGQRTAHNLLLGSAPSVIVKLRSTPSAVDFVEAHRRVCLIGTTEKFAFFYDHSTDRATAIPIADITAIEFDPVSIDTVDSQYEELLDETQELLGTPEGQGPDG